MILIDNIVIHVYANTCRTFTDVNKKNNVLTHSFRTKIEVKNVPNIKKLIFLYISMAFLNKYLTDSQTENTQEMWMFSILSFIQSRPFVLIRFKHLGHRRSRCDLNCEVFLVNKKIPKIPNIVKTYTIKAKVIIFENNKVTTIHWVDKIKCL